MESETLRRRSVATIKNLGVNTYSQIVSAFRAQGDLTDEQLTLLPALQNALGISRERHTAEVKRALNDEELTEIATSLHPNSSTINWEHQANYAFPPLVHRPPRSETVQFAEEILQRTPPFAIIEHAPPSSSSIHLNPDLKQLLHEQTKDDGIQNATQSIQVNTTMKAPLNNPEINGSNVIRLVRAKPTTKRQSSLDTLIEVVQKELRRVNEENPSLTSLPLSPSKTSQRASRAIIPPILPSSHPGSLTSQSNHSLKITRKTPVNHLKRSASHRSRQTSFNHSESIEPMEHVLQETIEEKSSENESIEDIVRETVDKLVAIISVNRAPFIVNMLPSVPGTATTHPEPKVSTNLNTIKVQSVPPKPTEPRTSPMKSQRILQSNPTSTTSPASTSAPTLFVAPRIINFQTVVPKPTTNIHIGNTKIILVSPSNITQHLPHTTSNTGTTLQTAPSTPSHPPLMNNSPVKLVKFTTTNSPNTLNNRSNSLPLSSSGPSTLTLPKNVQIVIPSQNPSTIQLTRTHNEEMTKSLANPSTATFRPINSMPMTLTTCAVNQIPPATQEVTITTSPNSSPPLNSNNPTDLPSTTVASIDRISPTSVVTRHSPSHDEMIKSMSINPAIRPSSSHGPMIYRMTSVNPNVPVFRVRTATAPTPTPTTMMNKTMKTEAKPITSMCYEPKATAHPTATPSGSVSVLACFKTTKKRNKERAIMPRPSATVETVESSSSHEPSPRLNSTANGPTSNASILLSTDLLNSNSSLISSSPEHPTRLLPQLSLPATLSDETSLASIPILRHNSTQLEDYSMSTSTPPSSSARISPSPPLSPIPTFQSTSMIKPLMEDKSIQCIEQNSNEIELDPSSSTSQKRKERTDDNEDRWIDRAENLLRDVQSHDDFRSLDEECREILTTKFQSLQNDLMNGSIPTMEQCSEMLGQLKSELTNDVHLESLFDYLHREIFNPSSEQKRLRSSLTSMV